MLLNLKLPTFFLLIITLPSTVFSQKRVQNAVYFDGMDDVMEISSTSSNALHGKNFTLEAWIKPASLRSDAKEGVVLAHHHAAPNRGYVLSVGGTGQLYFGVYDDSTYELTSGSNLITLNEWQHIAATFKNRWMKIFINGSLVDSVLADLDHGDPGSTPITVGRHYSLLNAFSGSIDEVRFWNRAFSNHEIQTNYNQSYCGFSTDLVGYYRFNNGRANATNTVYFRVFDWSGSNQRATLKNLALKGTFSNYVEGYRSLQQPLDAIDTVVACDFYRSPSRKFTWTQSGTYVDTILSKSGCDSAITIYLTVNSSTSSKMDVHTCGDYTFPSGKVVSLSGTYTDRIPNSQGCDSVITIKLKTGPDTTYVDTTVCQFFTLPKNQTAYTRSGSYVDTLANEVGCDSFVYYQAYVLPASRVSRTIRFCDSVTVPSSGSTYYSSQVVHDTLVNFQGCDSIITYNLQSKATASFYNDYSCGDYISPSGNYVWTRSAVYTDTLTNAEGCDSVITIDLVLTPITDTILRVDECRKYRAPSRRFLITESGTYYDTVMNVGGCDSLIEIQAEITRFNNLLEVNQDTLRATEGYAYYQWLDVSNDYQPIPGANQAVFIAPKPGEYAVQFNENSCSDTSEAIVIDINGPSVFQHIEFKVYPNPSGGRVFIEGENLDGSYVEVMDLNGRILLVESFMPHYEGKRYLDIPGKGLFYLAIIKGQYREVITISVK